MSRSGSAGSGAGAKACIPSEDRLLRAGRDEHHAHVRGRALDQRAGDLEQRHHAGRVVVGARHDPAQRRCRPARPACRRRSRCPARRSASAARAPSRAPPARARRTRGTSPAGSCRCARSAPGSAARRRPGSPGGRSGPEWAASWWATSTTVRSRVGGPDLGDDVVGACGAAARAGRTPAGGQVVPDRRCRGGADRGAEPRAGRAAPRCRPSAAAPVSSASGRQYSPCTRSSSIARLDAELGEARGDPFGRLALALGGGRPLDRRQLARPGAQLAQRGSVRRAGATSSGARSSGRGSRSWTWPV